jgi:microsomal dipeptidase-like Zn-dependent dipeptidase
MTIRGVRTAVGVVGVLLVSGGGCGLEKLPPHYPMPQAPGHDVAFQCQSDAPPPARPPSIFDWDDALADWPNANREGVFADALPIRNPSVHARDVVARWSRPQSDEFPTSDPVRRASLVPIGGDYWWHTSYPVATGRWMSSGFVQKPGDLFPTPVRNRTGTMWKAFTIDGDQLRVAVGGDDDPAVGIELLVEPKDGEDLSKCDTKAPQPRAVDRPAVKGRETYTSVYVRRGRGGEAVVSYDLPTNTAACPLKGRSAVLRVFDLAAEPHVNVGDIEVSPGAARPTPVWGVGDFHTHPTSYLGFGGLHGMHALWGVPGGSIKRYRNPKSVTAKINVSRDIPGCDEGHKHYNAHHGGFAAPLMINVSEARSSEDLKDLSLPIMADSHRSQGGPTFSDFPDFRRGAHQQYHITQIHRAYMGGLRLMTALALQNQGLEYGMGWVECGADGRPTVQVAEDMTVVRAHVEAMKQLAEANGDWMEIAYTPADARRIIAQNKLAIVLGVEVDQLGQTEDVDNEIAELERLGVRQVVMIHAVDNQLGGPAVFNDLYNSVNDWLNRDPKMRDWVEPLSGELELKDKVPESFFSITTQPLLSNDPDYEPILLRLGNPRRIVLSDAFPHPGPLTHKIGPIRYGVLHPFVNSTPIWDKVRGFYDGFGAGHRNTRGLTPRGAEYEARLMQRGMLIDVAHMSDAAVQDTIETERAHQCTSYPLMISHAHFRKLSVARDDSDRGTSMVMATSDLVRPVVTDALKHHIDNPMSACIQDHAKCVDKVLHAATRLSHEELPGPATVSTGNLPREYDIPTNEVKAIGARRGVIGVFLSQGMLDSSSMKLPFADDCAGSSKGFATSLLFAEQAMSGGGVGLATDFAFTRSVTPRFGVDACAAYLDAGSGSAAGAQLLETLIDPDQYRFAAQRTRVAYAPGGANEPLDPYVMGERTFDFNEDGLAHMGLVPDMLQDVANVLGPARDSAMDPLFGSAEAYIEMWERARAQAKCDDAGPLCHPGVLEKRDPRACGNACPDSWNGGAPLQSVDERYGVCRTGKAITMLAVDDHGTPISLAPVWAQHGVDLHPTAPVDLSKQGDWAVFPIRTRQLWSCGGSGPISLDCPPAANYVKVRRVLERTMGEVENCNWEPVPPAVGNKRVVFECLMGPPEGTP